MLQPTRSTVLARASGPVMCETSSLFPETSGRNGLGQLPQPARSHDAVRDISNLDAVGGREPGPEAVRHRSKASRCISTRQANKDALTQSGTQILRWRMSSGQYISMDNGAPSYVSGTSTLPLLFRTVGD